MKSKPFCTRLRSILFVIFILWLAIILWGVIFAWRRVPEYLPQSDIQIPAPIMDNEEYGQVIDQHERPYIVEIEAANGGAVLVYGAEHTKDPNDPQIEDIKTRWAEFHPTVALVESRLESCSLA
jgi:cytoskeletal protein RodZ